MASTDEAVPMTAYRCADCGRVEVRSAPPQQAQCPECGSGAYAQVPIESGAVQYTVACRGRGPSVEDGRLGRMAYFAGWMDFRQIALCLQRQKEAASRGEKAPRFGEVAAAEGFLTEKQVDALLRVQVIHNGPSSPDEAFGQVAVQRGYLTREQLDEALETQKSLLQRYLEAPVLGIILAEKRVLTSEQVKSVLEVQAEYGSGPLAELKGQMAESAGAPGAGVSIADLMENRILCRCGPCGATELRASWKAEDTCPACGSNDFLPVPIVGEAAEAGLGPSISDGRLGRLAYFAGWMTLEQVQECLLAQQEAVKNGEPMPRFGEAAVEKGFLSATELHALLRIQSMHRPLDQERAFGVLAVRRGFITQGSLTSAWPNRGGGCGRSRRRQASACCWPRRSSSPTSR